MFIENKTKVSESYTDWLRISTSKPLNPKKQQT